MIPMHMEMIGVGEGWGGVASIEATRSIFS